MFKLSERLTDFTSKLFTLQLEFAPIRHDLATYGDIPKLDTQMREYLLKLEKLYDEYEADIRGRGKELQALLGFDIHAFMVPVKALNHAPKVK